MDIDRFQSFLDVVAPERGATVLSAKILTLLLSHGADNTTIIVAACTVGAVATAQITINNMGLARYPPLVVVPIFVGTFVMSNALGGAVFFRDFEHFSPEQWQAYAVGCALVISGLLSLAAVRHHSQLPKLIKD